MNNNQSEMPEAEYFDQCVSELSTESQNFWNWVILTTAYGRKGMGEKSAKAFWWKIAKTNMKLFEEKK
jgi:hypothetical protein